MPCRKSGARDDLPVRGFRQPQVKALDLDRLLHSEEAKDFLRQGYDPVSPDGPERFDVVYAKTMTGSEPRSTWPGSPPSPLGPGAARGRDEVTLDMGRGGRALGDGRLAVLAGTHRRPAGLPEMVNPARSICSCD
jgi:hypothetical protein